MHFKISVVFLVLFLLAFYGFSQTATISGSVRNSENQPLVGASVGIQNSGTGTQTNTVGTFKLTVPVSQDINLIISYVGYRDFSILLNLKGLNPVAFQFF